MDFLFGPFLIWFPIVVPALLFVLVVFLYVYRHKLAHWKYRKLINFNSAIILAVSYRVAYALLNTAGQYYIWSQSKFTQSFLNSPVAENTPGFMTEWFPWLGETRWGYFLFYSWGRFWLNVFIILIVAYAFWIFLKFLHKYRDRFFDIGEVQLGLLISLIVGWPHFVIFIPAVCVFMVLISIFRGIFFKEAYTTLGWPFILGGAFALLAGPYLMNLFSLTYLRI